MSVYIACDKCEKRLKIPETVVGRPIKCPACGSVFKAEPAKVQPGIPAPGPTVEEPAPTAVARHRTAPSVHE
jgi:DNA-directed RNA polymerase subunit RPC12/RpoP